MTPCGVCGNDCGAIWRVMDSGARVCMACNPFRRCECLGVFVNQPLPNDMGRQICNGCGINHRTKVKDGVSLTTT